MRILIQTPPATPWGKPEGILDRYLIAMMRFDFQNRQRTERWLPVLMVKYRYGDYLT